MPSRKAQVPAGHREHTLHDTNLLPAGTVALHLAVTAAGVVPIEDENGTTVNVHFETGTHRYDMVAKRVKATGLTATLAPANKCVALVAE